MAAPTAITVQQMLAPFAAVGAGAADFTVAASTLTDGDTFVCTGRELLFVQNTDAGATTITITSVVDEKNRTGDITTYSVGIAEFACFSIGLTNAQGWKSSTGTVRITCSDVDLKVAVLRLPAGYPN
jgi:hypothetical protein